MRAQVGTWRLDNAPAPACDQYGRFTSGNVSIGGAPAESRRPASRVDVEQARRWWQGSLESLKDAAACIKSIVRNRKLILVQQEIGLQPISLLTHSVTPAASLVDGLSHEFEGLAETMTGRVEPPGAAQEQQEWWLTCSRYGIRFRSWQNVEAMTFEQAAQNMRSRLRRLAAKLLDDIRDGEKVFVFSDAAMRSPLDALPILAAMRGIGPAQLLVVLPCSSASGWTCRLGNGLIAGFPPHLTGVGDEASCHKPTWEDIIPQAHDEWLRAQDCYTACAS